MIHRKLHIRDWLVNVFIDDGGWLYLEPITSCLVSMGASDNTICRALELIEEDKPNQGFSISNDYGTCMFIGWTTSGSEFLNTMVHEIRHLVDAIAETHGLGNNEAVGYMSGNTALLLAEDICRLGCNRCRESESHIIHQ